MADKSRHTGAEFGGTIWVVGWMFTIGFLKLSFWKGFLALFVWPYFIGRFLHSMPLGE
jgi:hypothetical protein